MATTAGTNCSLLVPVAVRKDGAITDMCSPVAEGSLYHQQATIAAIDVKFIPELATDRGQLSWYSITMQVIADHSPVHSEVSISIVQCSS